CPTACARADAANPNSKPAASSIPRTARVLSPMFLPPASGRMRDPSPPGSIFGRVYTGVSCGMRRPLSLVAILAVLLGGSWHAQTPPEKTVVAAAVDGSGKPFTDLARQDWSVREDGQNRVVLDAHPTSRPLRI